MALAIDAKENVVGISVPSKVQAWGTVSWVEGDDTMAGAMSKNIGEKTDKTLLRPREDGGVLWPPVPRPHRRGVA